MNLPFSREEFLGVFARYNEAVWPAPIVLTGLAALAVFAVARRWQHRDRIANAILALLWLWSGLVYHLCFFATLTASAIGFGLMFLAQSAVFAIWGVAGSRIVFDPRGGRARFIVGAVLIGYALVIYPMLAFAFGQRWPEVPSFGAPCPVVLFTFGFLWWTDPSMPKRVFVVPILWGILGLSAAINFEMEEDWALGVAVIVSSAWLLLRGRANSKARRVALPPRTVLHRAGSIRLKT